MLYFWYIPISYWASLFDLKKCFLYAPTTLSNYLLAERLFLSGLYVMIVLLTLYLLAFLVICNTWDINNWKLQTSIGLKLIFIVQCNTQLQFLLPYSFMCASIYLYWLLWEDWHHFSFSHWLLGHSRKPYPEYMNPIFSWQRHVSDVLWDIMAFR